MPYPGGFAQATPLDNRADKTQQNESACPENRAFSGAVIDPKLVRHRPAQGIELGPLRDHDVNSQQRTERDHRLAVEGPVVIVQRFSMKCDHTTKKLVQAAGGVHCPVHGVHPRVQRVRSVGVRPRLDDCEPRRIIVALPTWVGDAVMATPTLRAIRRRFAEAHIAFLVEANTRPVIDSSGWMDEVMCWPPRERGSRRRRGMIRLATQIRRRGFALAVLLPNSFRSALLMRMAGVERRIGYARDGRHLLTTAASPPRSAAHHPAIDWSCLPNRRATDSLISGWRRWAWPTAGRWW